MKAVRDNLKNEQNEKNISLLTRKKLIEETKQLFEENLGLELDLVTDDEEKKLLFIKFTSGGDKFTHKTVNKIGLEISNKGGFKRKLLIFTQILLMFL